MPALHRRAAVTGVPLLRVVRRGDRHDVRDLIIDIDIALEADAAGVSSERLEAIVHALAPAHAAEEPERFALELARHCRERITGSAMVQVDVLERSWGRLEVSGRPKDTDLLGAGSPLRTARVRLDPRHEQVLAGCRDLRILSSATDGTAFVLTLQLQAQWTYGWTDVPFNTQWQQVRRALTDAYAERATSDPGELARALASAVLEESPAVRVMEVTLETQQRPVIDLSRFGMDSDGSVFGGPGAARGVHIVRLTREEINREGE